MIEKTQIVIIVFSFLFVTAIAGVISIARKPKVREHLASKEVQDALARVRNNFAKLDVEYAKIPLSADTSAYTEDKKRISLCLQDPQTGEMYPDNTIMYVALHELSHICNKEDYGHTDAFKRVFARLLKKAQAIGIYDPSIPLPSVYCGMS